MRTPTPMQWIEKAETRRVLSRELFERPLVNHRSHGVWWRRRTLPAVIRLDSGRSRLENLPPDRA